MGKKLFMQRKIFLRESILLIRFNNHKYLITDTWKNDLNINF